MRSQVKRWVEDNPSTVSLLQRCWRDEHRPGDSEALSAWVTRTVMRGFQMHENGQGGRNQPEVEKPYVCDEEEGCTARFAKAASLGQHKRWHRTRAAGPAKTAGTPPQAPSTVLSTRDAGASSSAVVPAPHDQALPAGVVALLFTDVPLKGVAEMFGDDVTIGVVAGKGLAVMKPAEVA